MKLDNEKLAGLLEFKIYGHRYVAVELNKHYAESRLNNNEKVCRKHFYS